MEAALECNLALANPAGSRYELQALSYLIPGGVELIARRVARRLDGLKADNKWVKFDDFAMAVEDVDG